MPSGSFKLCSLLLAVFAVGAVSKADESREAEMQRTIERLEKQNNVLRNSLAQAQTEAAETSRKFEEVRRRLEALGGATLGGSEERLVRATADIEVLNERIRKVEEAAVRLSGTIIAYIKQAVVEDPQTRANVESKLRDLDMVLGLRQQPLREGAGSLANANILSIDSESGLIVLNVGSAAGLRVGMPLRVTRGEQVIGEAIVNDVRKEIAGALVQKLENSSELVRVGDSVAVKTNNQ